MTNNLIDRLIDFGAGCDWITPAASLLSGDPTFTVPAELINEVDAELRAAGIRPRRRRVLRGLYLFDVDPEDGPIVCNLLQGGKP